MARRAPNAASLDDVLASSLARRESQGILRRLTTRARDLVDFSSNDYLSLGHNPDIKQDYLACLQAAMTGEHGGFALGSGGSRLLDGNSPMAESLERHLARFHKAPAGLLFNSGSEANTGLLACVARPGDVVLYDELVHASMHSGIKLSRAGRKSPFRHNSVWGDREESQSPPDAQDGARRQDNPASTRGAPGRRSLDTVLRELTEGEAGRAVRRGERHVFVAVEAVYSMDGDVAPLAEMLRCIERRLPMGNGHVIVDEAHSNGVFGGRGEGLVCHLGLESRVWARVHTFGKALGCSGAVVLCSATTRDYLINYARTFIYTTAMAFPGLLSIQVAYRFVAGSQGVAARLKLQELIRHTRVRLADVCSPCASSPGLLTVVAASVSSSIIPIFTTRARSLASHCQSRGYMVRAIVAPTVPEGTDRVRICLHAGNSKDECDGLCRAVEEWASLQAEDHHEQSLSSSASSQQIRPRL